MTRTELTQKIIETKLRTGFKWADVAEAVGRSKEWTTAALLGQATMDQEEASTAGKVLGLTDDDVKLLQTIPSRGADADTVPTDPLIYRFYEIVQVYGPSLKALIEEEFGDGIMSAIDFSMDIDRESNPAGDRVVVTLNGKFLSYKKY